MAKKSIIRNDEHVFIAGMTGSGKTYLGKVYCAGNEKPVFVLDTKGTFTWEQVPEELQTTITTFKDLPKTVGKFKFVIYRPAFSELNEECYDEFFKFCYYLQHCTVFVDEAMQVCPSPSKIPPFYKGILTRGRELDVNVWSCSQRPSGIPIIVYSEASHWFIFKLQTPADREKLSEFSGYPEFEEVLEKRYFYYYSVDKADPPTRGILVAKGG